MGVVTPIGHTVADFWKGLKQGRSGIGPVEGVELYDLKIRIAGQIKNFDHGERLKHWQRDKTILFSDRFSWLAAAAADEAIKQSSLEVPFKRARRVACVIGSGAGGQITGETASRNVFILDKRAVHPMTLPRIVVSSATAHVGIEYGVKGPTFATCGAGASAAHAISVARDYIRHGMADVAIVGGSDSMITYGSMLACQAMRLLSPKGCFPFSRNRNGTVLAEGAGVLVLESERHATERGVKMLAELRGLGMTSNSTDMASPDIEATSKAMRLALDDAKLEPAAIDYLNANGTATVLNDLNETKAIKNVFGSHASNIGVSSTKSMHGHPMGASGGIEAVACLKAMEDGCMPPTIGLDERDPQCDLDYVPNVGREKKLTYTMSNSFGLGGLNAVLVFGPPPA
jgi:nodulation protein E